VAQLADTVGAGDAFTAALVTGLLRGRDHDLDRINAFANRLAAYVCSQPGATPPIPAALADFGIHG
jgi:fructokinase